MDVIFIGEDFDYYVGMDKLYRVSANPSVTKAELDVTYMFEGDIETYELLKSNAKTFYDLAEPLSICKINTISYNGTHVVVLGTVEEGMLV